MRLDAAKAEEKQPEQRNRAASRARKRSTPVANAIALLCAVGLLALTAWFHGTTLLHSGARQYVALAITLAFGLAARLAHGVNTSGALAGIVTAFIMASRDLRIFWVLLVVFLVTLAATRTGTSRKRHLKMAEAESGRSASQVMANLGVAALLLAIPSFAAAYLLVLAALAEVAADTISSEIGTAFSVRAKLITTGNSVPPGTDGGISVKGTLAGILAALMIAACGVALGLVGAFAAMVVTCAGTAGMLVDSVLGAALEQRGYLNNDLVNLLSTAAAVLGAGLIAR